MQRIQSVQVSLMHVHKLLMPAEMRKISEIDEWSVLPELLQPDIDVMVSGPNTSPTASRLERVHRQSLHRVTHVSVCE